MATIKTLAAILPLLAFAPAAAEESAQPAYVMPQIPSEAEKIAALKLGHATAFTAVLTWEHSAAIAEVL
jgi:hypothetical protein